MLSANEPLQRAALHRPVRCEFLNTIEPLATSWPLYKCGYAKWRLDAETERGKEGASDCSGSSN